VADELDRLAKLVVPPQLRAYTHDWTSIERQVGTPLPDDYKRLVDRYGPGSFDRFIWIFQPMTASSHLDLSHQIQVQLGVLRERRTSEPDVTHAIFPETGGLLPWGVTDNGDVGFWRTTGGTLLWDVIVVEPRGPATHTHQGGLVSFLEAALSGRERVGVFPPDFPSSPPAFQPLAE
jgi:hypothetical protein